LGAKVCVVHPCNDYTAEENASLYRKLEPYAREAHVKIGVENMWNWNGKEGHACAAACSCHDDFRAHLSLLSQDVFVACLDIGHSEMKGLETSAPQMILALGDRLQAIHLHDNDRLNDSHALPYTMSIDFSAIIVALKKIGYQGDVTLEADSFIRKYPRELYPAAARFMAEVADDFRQKLLKS
jgi:sugar phosphate isomerase/epimerase